MLNALFFVWLLTLPFYQISFVGSLSIDNMLAPVLVVLWLLNLIARSGSLEPSHLNNIFKSLAVAFLYFLSHIASLIMTEGVVWTSAYIVMSKMIYFMIPILYIDSIKLFKRTNDAFIVIMFIASVTALFSALGIIELEFARQAGSRLGEGQLKKSVGVIDAYGDVGLIMSLSLLLVIAGRNERVLFGKGSFFKIALIIVFILIGLVSMQSRNMVLTILTALLAYGIIGHWSKHSKSWYKKLYIMVVGGITLSVLTVVTFYQPLLEFVQGIGGTKEAAGTVSDRLSQYMFMWDLVKDRIFIGATPADHERYVHEISLIHNMWLKELVQGGIFSIVAMLIIWGRALSIQVANIGYKIIHKESIAYAAVLLAMLVATEFYPAGTFIFWTLLGVSSVLLVRDNQETIEIKNKMPKQSNKYVELR